MLCLTPYSVKLKGSKFSQIVPCGYCIPCKINYASSWGGRLCIEHKKSKSSYFVTLTHNNDFVVLVDGQPCLWKTDLQKFFKRLRKTIKLKYYAVGEYGDERQRSHYHFIAFLDTEISFNDFYHAVKKAWSINEIDYSTNQLISTSMGHVDIEKTEAHHYGYITDYLSRRMHGEMLRSFKRETGLQPEFSLMSRRQGLGYLENWSDLEAYIKDRFIGSGRKKYKLHRYYKEHFKWSDMEYWEKQQTDIKEEILKMFPTIKDYYDIKDDLSRKIINNLKFKDSLK